MLREIVESNDLYVSEIAERTGLRKVSLKVWLDDNNIDDYELMQALGQKKLDPQDLVTAIVGNKNNSYFKDIVKKFKK